MGQPGTSTNIMVRNTSSILIGFSGYYGPLPNSSVVNCVAENCNISVRGERYAGIPGSVDGDRRPRE